MSDFKRVQSGQKLVIPAVTWNSVMEATEAYFRRGRDLDRPRPPLGSGTVLVYNDCGEALNEFSALSIDGPVIDPGDNADAFASRVAVIGSQAVTGFHPGGLVVLQEPVPAGGLGRAIIAGSTLALVNVTSTAHRFATLAVGSYSLASADSGPVQILWAPGAGEAICLVRIGNESGAALPSNAGKSKHMVLTLSDDNAGATDNPALVTWDYERFV